MHFLHGEIFYFKLTEKTGVRGVHIPNAGRVLHTNSLV